MDDGIYFVRRFPDEHWLMVTIVENRVFAKWIAGNSGCHVEHFNEWEWSNAYDKNSPEVLDANSDCMGAARNHSKTISSNAEVKHER